MKNKILLTPNKYKGKLIVFEVTDGAGKTTLISLTHDYLKSHYREEDILLLKQPTDLTRKTKLFQKMIYAKNNKDINYRAVQLLTMSDRLQQNHEIIIPALKQGKIILCDRYIYTSFINMISRNYKKEKWFHLACKEIIKPDLALLIYINPEIAIKRIRSRKEEMNKPLNKDLLRKVAFNFKKNAKKNNLQKIITDTKPEKTFEKVKILIDKVIEK